MPVYTIQAPDGRKIKIEAADEATAVRGAQEYSSASAPPSRKSQALGFYKGVMKPLDNAAMGLEAGLNRIGVPTAKINALVGGPSASQAADNHKAFVQSQAARGVKPGAIGEFAGNVVGTLPIAAVTKNPVVAGAIGGAALTDSRNVGGVLADAAIGAVTAKVADTAIKGVSEAIKPYATAGAQRLQDMGIRLTPGQMKGGRAMVREDKMMSKPFVGDAIAADRARGLNDFNRAAVNEALKPLGIKVPNNVSPGFDSVGFADDTITAAYNRVVPKLSLNTQPSTLTAQARTSVPQSLRADFDGIVSDKLGNGQLQGRALKNAEGELRRLASNYARSADANQRELGFALGRVHDRLSAAMIAQNPTEAPALKAVNRAFRGFATIRDAASRADDGLMSPGGFKQAVRRADVSKGKGASARGAAFMQKFANDAKTTLPSKYPDSGTAGRSAGLIKSVAGAAQLAGYRAHQALNAIPRPQALSAPANALLNNRNSLVLIGPAAVSTDQ